ncbi:carbohydrate sulfotransferase 3 [Hyalella azteca]|uniref:Carbohydrate sulfotransferase 3 n=1 Tax=Hyalella azteca TaxID=294128 RepID=A0A8B7NFV4_HYAAZ|nr:carbohydrate sulfotransferase 3 [Hyalella azteca]
MVVHCKFDFSMTFIDDLDHDFCFTINDLPQPSCNTPEFLTENCRRSRVLLLKVVTPRLVLAERLLAEYPHLNIKIIHLIRDPRAIIASARRMPWDKNISLNDENILCSNLRSDMKTGDVIERTHPNRRMRYEDLAMAPLEIMKKIFKFLDEPFTPRVATFMRKHTHALKEEADIHELLSTKKMSKKLSFQWRLRNNFSEVEKIQDACRDVIQSMHLKMFTSAHEYATQPLDVRLS